MTSDGEAREMVRREEIGTMVFKAIQFGYNNYVRPQLPPAPGFVTKNGVKVGRRRWFDSILPFQTFPVEDPTHEEAYVAMARKYVDTGQRVVIVGGGWGVSTVVAAKQVGEAGSVTCFEASKIMTNVTSETVRMNGVEAWTEVIHAIVSDDVRIDGAGVSRDASVVTSGDLPDCDVLMIDCDGCERKLVADLKGKADMVILEHHAILDGNTVIKYRPDEIGEKLEEKGYNILERNVAAIGPGHDQFGNEQTIFVAKRKL